MDEETAVRLEDVPAECCEGAVREGVIVMLELREAMDWLALFMLGRRVLVPELELLLSAWWVEAVLEAMPCELSLRRWTKYGPQRRARR